MSKAVFGLVDSESQAERIVDNLKAAGFSNNDISVLFPIKLEPGISHTKKPPRLPKAPRQEQVQVESSAECWVGSSASVP